MTKKIKFEDKKIKNILTIITIIVLILFGIKYFFFTKSHFILDVVASIILLGIFYKLYYKLNQEYISYFFLIILLILHSSSLYGSNLFGLQFENLLHFMGGFTIAIITDRLFKEKSSKIKRFTLLIIFALGIGAIIEIVEWSGYHILGEGEGLFYFGVGDEDSWNNTIIDLIFNASGAILMGLITLFRKK